jgi:hypothetical protein
MPVVLAHLLVIAAVIEYPRDQLGVDLPLVLGGAAQPLQRP